MFTLLNLVIILEGVNYSKNKFEKLELKVETDKWLLNYSHSAIGIRNVNCSYFSKIGTVY
jgi:hypothetical protein